MSELLIMAEVCALPEMPSLHTVVYLNTEQSKSHVGSEFLSCHTPRCFNINARSMCNKFDQFAVLVNRSGFSFDVLMIIETWYTDHNVFALPMYQTNFINRPCGGGGKTLLIVQGKGQNGKERVGGSLFQDSSDPGYTLCLVQEASLDLQPWPSQEDLPRLPTVNT